MTVKELNELRYLKREITAEKRRLRELADAAVSMSSTPNGMPRSSGKTDRTALYACELAYLRELIADNMNRAVCRLLQTQQFINSIDDSLTRQIFTLRYFKGKSWLAVSIDIGLCGEHVPRRIHDEYMRKHGARTRAGEESKSESANETENDTPRTPQPPRDSQSTAYRV